MKEVLTKFAENDANVQPYEICQPMRIDAIGMEFTNINVDKGLISQRKNTHKLKEIIALNQLTQHIMTYQVDRNQEYLKHRDVRFIDNPMFTIYNDIYIKGDYIYISCAQGDEVYGLIINSKVLASTLLSFFNIAWLGAIPLTTDILGKWGKNEFSQARSEKSKV